MRYKKYNKTHEISLLEFFIITNNLEDFKFHSNTNVSIVPSNDDFKKLSKQLKDLSFEYVVTEKYFVLIDYRWWCNKYSKGKWIRKICDIRYAKRDGITEYKHINHLIKVFTGLNNKKFNLKWEEKIRNLYDVFKHIPKFKNERKIKLKFENCLKFTENFKANSEIDNRYVVLDVETNGLAYTKYDVLEFSIYDPSQSIIYDRLLPLDLQQTVLTIKTNDIKDNMLYSKTHISQNEWDKIKEFFNLDKKTILVYSEKIINLFDKEDMFSYLKRHNINRYENLKFENIYNKIASPNFINGFLISKDNICDLIGIKGVKSKHSCKNDCLLEWQLFSRIYKNGILVDKDGKIFLLSKDCLVSATYADDYKILLNLLDIIVPEIKVSSKIDFWHTIKLKTPLSLNPNFFSICGRICEELIYNKLQVKESAQSKIFLIQNKAKLKYLGRIKNTNFINYIVSDGKVKLSKDFK